MSKAVRKPLVIQRLEKELANRTEGRNRPIEYKTAKGKVTELDLWGYGLKALPDLQGLESLSRLDIGGNSISDLRPIRQLKNLTELDISGNGLWDISALATLELLQSLSAVDNGILDLSPLSALTMVNKVFLQGNPVTDIGPLLTNGQIRELGIGAVACPSYWEEYRLNELTYLHISGRRSDPIHLPYSERLNRLSVMNCQLADLDELGKLISLERLVLQNNQLNRIDEVCNLKNLKILSLSENQVSDIELLRSLEQLTNLVLRSNAIALFPQLRGLTKLAELDISLNPLEFWMPVTFLTALKKLSMDDTGLSSMQGINELSGLQKLSVKSNRIEDLAPISELGELEELIISSNEIFSLEPLRNLRQLIQLDISDNHIVDIEPLSGLRGLETLSAANNDIEDIGCLSRLARLTLLNLEYNKVGDAFPIVARAKLKEVKLTGNPAMEELPSEIVQESWPTIRDYLHSKIRQETFEPLRELKMLFLGNTNAGKSNLLHYLQNGKLPTNHNSTHGLVYAQIKSLLPDTTVHCWDFGGQEYFHATHQLFFSSGALHLVLWCKSHEAREGQQSDAVFELPYWLRCIDQLAMDSSGNSKTSVIETILIENKIDKEGNTACVMPLVQCAKRFEHLSMHFAAVSLKERLRLSGLKELIKERVESLIQEYPQEYLVILRKIRSRQAASIDIATIDCNHDRDYVKRAVRVFHNIGCLLYFPQIIPDKVFINPSELLKLLYERILGQTRIATIAKDALQDAIKGNSLKLNIDEVIALLEHFHLVFTIPGEADVYYIPQYLPTQPAWMQFFSPLLFAKAAIRIESDSYLMHQAMLRIFSKYGRYAKRVEGQSFPLFWKDGILIEKADELLLVTFDRPTQSIVLYPGSKKSEAFTDSLAEELVRFILEQPLQDRNNRLTPDEQKRRNTQKHSPTADDSLMEESLWESKYFDVFISNDGIHFVRSSDLITGRQKGIFSIEATSRNSDAAKTKIVSVFDYNKYLPGSERGIMKKLFISYSKADLALIDTFTHHLTALKRDGLIATWYCTELTAGSDWNIEIQHRFDECDLVCFMVSPNFMRTEYIHEHEIAKAFKRKEENSSFRIVPIILDFCRWTTKQNDLAQFTALPYTAKPVVDFYNQNMAWHIITECLRLMLERDIQPEGDTFFENDSQVPQQLKELYKRIVGGQVNAGS